MTRYPTPSVENQTKEQQAIEPWALKLMMGRFPQLEYKDEQGNMLGPFAPMYCHSELASPWFTLAHAVVGMPDFSVRERELAVFAVIAFYDCPFVLYAHSEIGVKCGFSKQQIQDAINRRIPEGLTEQEAAIYNLALYLASHKGPISQDVFDSTERVIGKVKIVGVVHLVVGYVYVSLMANVAGDETPRPKEGAFLATREKPIV